MVKTGNIPVTCRGKVFGCAVRGEINMLGYLARPTLLREIAEMVRMGDPATRKNQASSSSPLGR